MSWVRPEARATGPTTPQERAFSLLSTPTPMQRERAVVLVVKMGMMVETMPRSSTSTILRMVCGSSMSRLTPPMRFMA